ncbi:MAG: GNAT family N-acetyltransferase [Solirubrobacterales bacterium]|nr:GNAT family N-acetyltransferase [Solirubrobacterales bacterium]
MSAVAAGRVADADLLERIERHASRAWPATLVSEFGDGWLLRATPGLFRARSNNTLTPRRPLSDGELDAALAATLEWAEGHGTPVGMQVVPLDLHAGVVDRLCLLGWEPNDPVQVFAAPRERIAAAGEMELVVTRGPDPAWIDTWAEADPSHDRAAVQKHAATVFANLGERGLFMRGGDDAVGIAVEGDGLVGLFSLAVRPEARRRGLGRRLVRAMLAHASAQLAYLQVSSGNTPAVRLYESLGFEEIYRYQHVSGPSSVASAC